MNRHGFAAARVFTPNYGSLTQCWNRRWPLLSAVLLLCNLGMAPSDANDLKAAGCSLVGGNQVSPCTPHIASKKMRLHWVNVTLITNPADPRTAIQSLFGGMLAGPGKDALMRGSLNAAQANGDPQSVVADRIQLATGAAQTGRFSEAAIHLEEALKTSRSAKYAEGEAAVLADLGVVDAAQGRYPEAMQSLQQSSDIYARLADVAREPRSTNRPNVQALLSGDLAARAGFARESMTPIAAIKGLDVTALNLGAIKAYLGQYQEAMEVFHRALSQHSTGSSAGRDSVREGTKEIYLAMASVASLAGHEDEANGYTTRAGEASESNLLTNSDALLGYLDIQPPSATFAADILPITPDDKRLITTLGSETLQNDLLKADVAKEERDGHAQQALSIWLKLAARAEAHALVDSQRIALSNAQRLARVLKQSELEIYLGKRAVNAYQSQRGRLASLDREARKTFSNELRLVYESLADSLIDARRLGEAEMVLHLLSETDLFPTGIPAAGVPYTIAEGALVSRENRLLTQWRNNAEAKSESLRANPYASTMTYLDTTYNAVRESSVIIVTRLIEPLEEALRAGRTDGARSYLQAYGDEIRAQMDSAFGAGECGTKMSDPREADLRNRFAAIEQAVGPVKALNPFGLRTSELNASALRASGAQAAGHYACLQQESDGIETSLSQVGLADIATLSVSPPTFSEESRKRLDAQQALMRAMPVGTVTLHFVLGEHAIRILLTTQSGRVSRDSPTTAAELNALIDGFARSLTNPSSDPRVPAQALYRLLIAPVAQDLKQARAITLQLALDGALRYVPFAALYDGDHWLVEQYTMVSETSRPAVAEAGTPVSAWRIAAFGNSRGGAGLPALPSVPQELRGIVHSDPEHANDARHDILRLDDQFTAAALREALAQHFEVVHIASHFDLLPADPSDSFLLLGNGERLTLTELKRGNYRFDGVRLLTLSACETARDVSNHYGQELEGLATFMQNQGAGAVLSTLWSVDDASTAMLMEIFYRAKLGRSISTAQALRDAQLALIGTRALELDAGVGPRGAMRPSDDRPTPMADRDHPYAHPYYWAPFVLSGNWL